MTVNYKIASKEEGVDYSTLPAEHSQRYKDLIEEAKVKLGLKTPISVKLHKWWRFEVEDGNFIINAPPFDPGHEPTFVHYLCHAKILDEGWLRPAIEHSFTDKVFEVNKLDKEKWEKIPQKEKDSLCFNFINRAADSFFDFFVWQFVTKQYGKKYLLEMIGNVDKNSVNAVIAKFDYIYKDSGFKYFSYIFTLDYFAMFWVITKTIDPKKHEDLEAIYRGLLKKKEFKDLVVPDIDKKVEWMQKFYTELQKKYPTFKEFLADKEAAKQYFIEYYEKVWEGTGLQVTVEKFV